MKILVISANRKLLPDPVYPLGAAFVATICRENGHDVQTFDCNFKIDIQSELSHVLNDFKPQIICLSMRNVDNTTIARPISFLPDFQLVMDVCRQTSDAKIILGGSGYSLFPQKFFDALQPDYGVIGNAGSSFIDLLAEIQRGKSNAKIIYGGNNNQEKKDIRIDRSFFDLQKYSEVGGLIGVQTQRGCVFKCAYCTYPFLEGYRLNTRIASDVVDELAYLKHTFGTKYFFIVDSVFNHSEKHVREICREIINRKLGIKWSAYLRPKFHDADIFGIMREAGCKSIELGTDALAEPTLQSMQKGFTIDDVHDFCEQTRKAGIAFCHSLIFGAPGETEETIETTVKNVQATKPTAALAFAGIRILPQTALADYCLKSGYLKNEDEITIEPVFYIEPKLDKNWILNKLKDVAVHDKRWIVPGLTTPHVITQKLMRMVTKNGQLWEFKKYATMGQRLKETLIRK
ncbi:MAG: radical SAM protein [Calditrichaceae bacterium]|nr:radical SAM protein [Calditrichaceae bacterium]